VEAGQQKEEDRHFIAFLEEWNERHPDLRLSPEIQEMVARHLAWARVIGAESVIHNLRKALARTDHHNCSYSHVMELIRVAEPDMKFYPEVVIRRSDIEENENKPKTKRA
jgi:hypothetical protein